ncbi:ABC-type dipeptide/oligopeptide/nickel transport system, permease component [Clostridium aceticum]|uniref:ABC-type dipeptide/oligopeptide/nickel transport system, permease component n=1 Tax=Clostridium aceticum TaxID=84022 RepID=A0A0G3WFW6_9CLOT|nr:nickel transporter permease [Clostridium aceticum]AKL96329.1 ABC-type dipeptide/oligopeptide/nickel transport system, permease component [Clostridium aceticum]
MIERLKLFFQYKVALVGSIIIILITFIGLFAPYLVLQDPMQIDLSNALQSASRYYPFGTDHLGRCVYSRIIYGTRISLSVSFTIVFTVMTIGTTVGLMSGYIGKRFDRIVVSIVDIILAFPSLILAIVITGILGPGLVNVMIAIIAVHWVGYARVVRSMVISIKEREYVIAARTSGTNHFHIIIRHILPNILSTIIVLASLDMGGIILSISGLSFLGLGAQPPAPEWGAMLNDGKAYFLLKPDLMIYPGLAILLTVFSFNITGDGLRDFFDPKSHTEKERSD